MENGKKSKGSRNISRRSALKTAGALLGAGVAGISLPLGRSSRALAKTAWAGSEKAPLKIGFLVHRTGIGAGYGRGYERTANAAAKLSSEMGGIAGRPVQLVPEDDGTDPRRGTEVLEKLAVHHKVDFVYGTLFSHVVIATAPIAGELKIPYFVASEGYHVPSGRMNRYVFQPGITDVRSQITGISSWMVNNLGKKVTMIFPDYAFGYTHRDFLSQAVPMHGG